MVTLIDGPMQIDRFEPHLSCSAELYAIEQPHLGTLSYHHGLLPVDSRFRAAVLDTSINLYVENGDHESELTNHTSSSVLSTEVVEMGMDTFDIQFRDSQDQLVGVINVGEEDIPTKVREASRFKSKVTLDYDEVKTIEKTNYSEIEINEQRNIYSEKIKELVGTS